MMVTRKGNGRLLTLTGLGLGTLILLAAPPVFGRGRPVPPPASRTAPAVRPLTVEDRQLVQQYGKEFLARLWARDYTARQFLRAYEAAKAGIDAYHRKEFGDATYLFNKGYGIVPSPNLLFFMGMTYDHLGNHQRAWQYLARYLREAEAWELTPKDPKIVAQATAKLKELSARLVALQVAVNLDGADVFIDGEAVGKTPLPGPLYLMTGTSKVTFTKQGYATRELVITERRPGATVKRIVKLLSPEDQLKETQAWKQMQQVLAARREREERRVRQWRRVGRIGGPTFLGVGVAALIVGGVMVPLANREADLVRNASSGTAWESLSSSYDRARTFQIVGYVGVVSGIVFAVTGAVLSVVGYRSSGRPGRVEDGEESARGIDIIPVLGPERIGLTLGGRF